MDTKKAVWTMIICGAMAAGLLAVPDIVLNTVPTATAVEVEKVEHTDSLSLSGSIIKNFRDETMSVQLYVSEQDISKVMVGQKAEITGDAFPEKTYTGIVDKISETAAKVQLGNVQKTAVEVIVKIDDPDDFLKHGYTASVKLATSEPYVMNIVPYEAVQQDNGGEYVYMLQNGKAVKKYVETGAELSSGVEIKTPIADTEHIVAIDKLVENGDTVKLGGKYD